MYADKKLKHQLKADWDHLMEHVREVNSDIAERFYEQPLTFDLDAAQDRLKVTIGEGHPTSTYTQGANNIYFDLDIDTDVIEVITFREVSEYMKEHAHDPVWTSLLDVLRLVKTIEVPPVTGRDSGRDQFARGLSGLIFA